MNIIFFWTLIIFIGSTQSMILPFEKTTLDSGSNGLWWSTVYSRNDTPAGDKTPYVEMSLEFVRGTNNEPGHLEIFIFEKRFSEYIGVPSPDGPKQYCCTSKELVNGNCSPSRNSGYVIYTPDKRKVNHWIILFEENVNTTTTIFQKVSVNITGVWIFLIVNCADNGVGDVSISGTITWFNPYGYLPGDVYMNLPVSGFLALSYLIVVIGFSILSCKYRKILMKLQYGILGVLLLGMVEMALWYFYRLSINNSGYYNSGFLLFIIFISNIRKTVSRVLVLLISMGFGVVKWTLGTAVIKIGILAVFYMFFSFLYQTIKEIENLSKQQIVSEWFTLVVIVFSTALETGFYYWIILSLIRTMQQLTLRKQILKLEMYKKFFAVLVVSGILAGIVVLYQGYLQLSGNSTPWQHYWVGEAFWGILFFLILASVAFLWRPRSNNTRYGYGEFFNEVGETEEEKNEENDIPLKTISIGGGMTKRKKSSDKNKENYDRKREKNLQKTKVKYSEFEKDLLSFDLQSDDDDEISLDTQINKMD